MLRLHLHPTGIVQRVTAAVDVWLATEPVAASVSREQVVWTERVTNRDAHGDYSVRAEGRLVADQRLLGVFPFMNRAGRSMGLSARLPDGVQLPLVTLDRWDPSWPERYRFSVPIDLPATTALVMEAWFHGGPEQTSLAPALAGLRSAEDDGPAGCVLDRAVPVLPTDSSRDSIRR